MYGHSVFDWYPRWTLGAASSQPHSRRCKQNTLTKFDCIWSWWYWYFGRFLLGTEGVTVVLSAASYLNFKCNWLTWAHMTRPFFQQNQAPFPGLWNHAEVEATQIAPRVVQKAPLLIRSGKYLICVCKGVVLRQCDLNKDERRVALGTIWCKVNLYFVRSCFSLYRILCIWHLHVHGDQITMNTSMYILCCSGKIV